MLVVCLLPLGCWVLCCLCSSFASLGAFGLVLGMLWFALYLM